MLAASHGRTGAPPTAAISAARVEDDLAGAEPAQADLGRGLLTRRAEPALRDAAGAARAARRRRRCGGRARRRRRCEVRACSVYGAEPARRSLIGRRCQHTPAPWSSPDVTALVTGANGGIGRALTEALAARPLRLVLAGMRDPGRFEPVARRARRGAPGADGPLLARAIEDSCAGLGDVRRRRPARQQRRPGDRRAARGAGRRRGLRDVPGQPRRGRAPHRARAARHGRARRAARWSTTPRSAATRASPPRARTPPRRPASWR